MSHPTLAPFALALEHAPVTGVAWLDALRTAARERLVEQGLPSQRVESWKFTSLRPVTDLADLALPDAAERADVPVPDPLVEASGPRIVLVDGVYRADLSTLEGSPEGLTVERLSERLARDPDSVEPLFSGDWVRGELPFTALNTVLMTEGTVIELAPGTRLEAPLEILHLVGLGEVQSHPRLVVRLGRGAEATLVERVEAAGDAPGFTNALAVGELSDGAILHHVRLQEANRQATAVNAVEFALGRDARYEGFTLTLGGRLTRNESRLRLLGEGGFARLSGAYLTRGEQHVDTTTEIHHQVPNTSCREVFKGVLDDRSRGVFQGKLFVHPGAQQTDGHQLSRALLLSDRAEMNGKPELEIYADDVKCSHGATVGDLDADALFYLRARGLPLARARALLVHAFVVEGLEEVADEALRAALVERVEAWLETLT